MPESRTHIIVGWLTIAVLTGLNLYFKVLPTQWWNYGLAFFLGYFSSQIPDIDYGNIFDWKASSRIFKIMTWTVMIAATILVLLHQYVLCIVVSVCYVLIQVLGKHRGFFHSIAFAILATGWLAFYNVPLAILAFSAQLSHLIIDREVKLF